MKHITLLFSLLLFINCSKKSVLDKCIEESTIKESSIYGTWLLKSTAIFDDVSFDTTYTCHDVGSIVSLTSSNTFSWDRISGGDVVLIACSQKTLKGTFVLSEDATEKYIELSYTCDGEDKLWKIEISYAFNNQYLITSQSGGCPCVFSYTRLR